MADQLQDIITREDIAEVAESERLHFDEDRCEILEAMRSIDVQACPGSGKTTLIATKLILLAKKWPFPDRGACVLSHTNVAKDEIIDRIKKSKTVEAQRLLSYPHFIGTIQEFVGKYVAFPLIRSDGTSISMVDTDACVELIYSKLKRKTRNYIDRKNKHSNVLYDFDLNYAGGEISVNVPTFPNGSPSPSHDDLLDVRKGLLDTGHYFYRDIFAFATMALMENDSVSAALRNRFSCVLLDEMQDTQKYQDELLGEIFPLTDSAVIVQRFGDPDQAIFHGIGSEEPNQTFNNKSANKMDFVIKKSHRFDSLLAGKIKCFSLNEVPLATELAEVSLEERAKAHVHGESFKPRILVFDDDSRKIVVERFSQIVSQQFAVEYKNSKKFTAKIVGAVGKEIDPDPEKEQLKIAHYWGGYDKSKSKSKYVANTLIEAVRYCRRSSTVDWSEVYKFLNECILKLMRLAEKRDEGGRCYSSTTLRHSLEQRGYWVRFRKGIHHLLSEETEINQSDKWTGVCSSLRTILDLPPLTGEAAAYMAFVEDSSSVDEDVPRPKEKALLSPLDNNRIQHSDGFQLEISTIHGVKGETHDATLVLETKNHIFDLEAMLPYLTGALPNAEHPNAMLPSRPNSQRVFKPNQFFMRQFYVAVSRPRHLLCLAIHADRISETQRGVLEGKGWKIKPV